MRSRAVLIILLILLVAVLPFTTAESSKSFISEITIDAGAGREEVLGYWFKGDSLELDIISATGPVSIDIFTYTGCYGSIRNVSVLDVEDVEAGRWSVQLPEDGSYYLLIGNDEGQEEVTLNYRIALTPGGRGSEAESAGMVFVKRFLALVLPLLMLAGLGFLIYSIFKLSRLRPKENNPPRSNQ